MTPFRATGLCSRIEDGQEAAWFPTERGHRTAGQIRKADMICRRCPVRDQCISFGLVYAGHEDYATYGGMRRKELQVLARMMRRDGLDMRRRKDGKEQRYRQAVDWLDRHPEAVREAKREALDYWRSHYRRRSGTRSNDTDEPARLEASPA